MSKIRELIKKENRKDTTVIEGLQIKTVRLEIQDLKALLPLNSVGDIIMNTAQIFNTVDSYDIQKEVTVQTDGTYILFNSGDVENGNYCLVSYMGVA